MIRFLKICLVFSLVGLCFCHYNLIDYEGEGCSFFGYLELINPDDTAFGEPLINNVSVKINCYVNNMIFIEIGSEKNRKANSMFDFTEKKDLKDEYMFEINQYPFFLKIIRKSDEFVIFNSFENDYLILTEHYVSLRIDMGSNSHYFGFGERNGDFKLKNDESYALFAENNAGCPIGMPCYASHPFGLRATIVDDNSIKYSGIFWHNTHLLRVTPHDDNIHFDATGGALNFAIYCGQTPLEILKDQRINLGLPIEVPDWSLGWQQCRWGLHDLNEVKEVVKNFSKFDLPLEIIYMDIDYMDGYRDFTSDPDRFPTVEIKEFSDSLHNNGQRLAMIIDPGIKYELGYEPYERLVKSGAFIRHPNGSAVINYVWPGLCLFPDFSDERSHSWWANELEIWWKKTGFDLVWLDMNEPAAFAKPKFQTTLHTKKHFKKTNGRLFWGDFDPNNPRFNPLKVPLNKNSLDARSQTYYGSLYSEHNLYGYWEGIATRKALNKFRPNEKVPIVTRSSFPGSGKYVSSWLGDDTSTWSDLKLSIPNLMQMNLQGIIYSGSDMGGYKKGNLADNFELCARWIQAFSLAPFARMHTAHDRPAQYPWTWTKLIPIAKKAMDNRYIHMPYLYKTMLVSQKLGIPYWQPLWMSFPQDMNMLLCSETQFLIGSDILHVPVITPDTNYVIVYFPTSDTANCDVWYHYDQLDTDFWYVPGQPTKITTFLETTNLFYRGGSMMLTTVAPQNTVYKARRADMVLNVFFDRCGNAEGISLMDDGLTYDSKQYQAQMVASAVQRKVAFVPQIMDWKEANNIKITKIRIIGLKMDHLIFKSTGKIVHYKRIGNSEFNFELDVQFTLFEEILITW
eukprot:TRINITY_DN2751_c0_g3_i1.p1 TRINITY_DN2751_c0_g3~~TRINITY_DN2751_c0_g3_i1.p1  ORF type:complete len:851 (+),score=170.40 TRINITY_DN2751_c0_g3_i1:668-3220(+)